MPQNSLQDLRDDWEIGDKVQIEYSDREGIVTSVRAGKILKMESAFALVQLEDGPKQKFPYKRLRRARVAPRPAPRPVPESQILRTVPPALAKLGDQLQGVVPSPAVTSDPFMDPKLVRISSRPMPTAGSPTYAPKSDPFLDQKLVKMAPKTIVPAPVAAVPVSPTLAATPESVVSPESVVWPKLKSLTSEDLKDWLTEGEEVLKRMLAVQETIQQEYAEIARQAQQLEGEIGTFQKLRAFFVSQAHTRN